MAGKLKLVWQIGLLPAILLATACTRTQPAAQEVPPHRVEEPQEQSHTPDYRPKRDLARDAISSVDIAQAQDAGLAMAFQKEDFAKYAINADDLFYEAAFIDAQGTKLSSVPRTKLPFDAATNSAKVILKVKKGSRGVVELKVEEGSGDGKFEGRSQEITVSGDTDVALTLKRVTGNTGSSDEAEVTIDITLDEAASRSQDATSNATQGSGDPTSSTTSRTQGVASSVSYKKFEGQLTTEQLNRWMEAHKAKKGADARFFFYTYIPADLLSDQKQANLARIGISKALNHTAINAEDIYNGEDASEGHGILFAFDARKFWGEGDAALRKWRVVAEGRGKTIFASAPNQRLAAFNPNAPVPADRLVYNAMHGKIYNVLIDTPSHEYVLRRNYKVKNEVLAWAAQKNAIVYGPRVAWLRMTEDGRKYWATGDEFFGQEGKEIPYASGNPIPQFRNGPTDGMLALKSGGAVASEAWMEMKNGLIAYYVWGNASQERTRAEQTFVIDPRMPDRYLITGRSCVTCHTGGVQAAPSDMWTYIEQGRVRDERARQFWTPNDKLAKLYAETRVKWNAAMSKIVNNISDGDKAFHQSVIDGAEKEPVLMLVVERIDRGINSARLATSVGTGSTGSSGTSGRTGSTGRGGFGSFGLLPGHH